MVPVSRNYVQLTEKVFIINFQFISYLILLILSALITLSLSLYAYKYRNVRGAKAFALSMLIGSLWALSNGFEMACTDLIPKIFWANFQYLFYTFAPVTWLIMVFEFTGREDRVNKKNIFLISIIPIITIVMVWSNSYHHLIRFNVGLNTEGPFPVIAKEYGLWFRVHLVYCYILNSYNIFLLIKASRGRNAIYRKQIICLFTGFVIIFLSNFMYVMGLSPIKLYDITPVLFSVSALIIGWGIFYFQLFDLVPVARTRVIEEMAAGIIVVDKKKRIIDINPRAKEMFAFPGREDYVGQKLGNISNEMAVFISFNDGRDHLQQEISIQVNEKKYYYELFSSPIRDYRKEQVAMVLIINDITDLKQARDQINRQQQELAIMDERERMARDLHDNLGQILSFSGIQIQAVRQQLKKENLKKADEYLLELKDIVRNAHKNIREYVYNVRDNDYYKEDLILLLKKLIKEFRNNSDIKVNFNIDIKDNNEDGPLSFLGTEEKLHLINIFREALTNILKYAEADLINIFLQNDTGNLKLIIEDNGKGITRLKEKSGSGINIMNERVRLIGGQFKIESQPDMGTRVVVTLPCNRGDNLENNDS